MPVRALGGSLRDSPTYISFSSFTPFFSFLVFSLPYRSDRMRSTKKKGMEEWERRKWTLAGLLCCLETAETKDDSATTSQPKLGVGLWLSLNVLSFQTSLETWTTAAIINWKNQLRLGQVLFQKLVWLSRDSRVKTRTRSR